jgi:sporulation protein YlmC with PRC-barrel domain
MPQELLFRLGAVVRCTDGDCGMIKSLVIDPAEDTVTHLMVEPAHRVGLGKLVPRELVETAPASAEDGIRLRCTMAEFEKLDAAEATESFAGDKAFEFYGGESIISWPYYAPPGAVGGSGLPADFGRVTHVVTVDTVPDQLPDEDEVSAGERVHATDGDIGHVQGIVADPGTGRVTGVLLRERHLLGRRTVLIPRSAVAAVDADGFHLDLTTHQVRDLPAAGIGHP